MTRSRSILELKRKAIALGLCGEYKCMWDNSTTQKDLADMALDINGADFICSSVANGWGLTKEYLLSNFNGLINGDYVAKNKGYTSEIYIGHSGKINVHTTILIVLYSDVYIHVQKNHVCRIFTAENTKINIQCDGICDIVNYTPNDDFEYKNNGEINIVDPQKDKFSWINFSSKDEKE